MSGTLWEGGLAHTNLVAEDDWHIEASTELFEGKDIMVRETRTAVEQVLLAAEMPELRSLEVIEDPVPRLVRFASCAKVHFPCGFRHRCYGRSVKDNLRLQSPRFLI